MKKKTIIFGTLAFMTSAIVIVVAIAMHSLIREGIFKFAEIFGITDPLIANLLIVVLGIIVLFFLVFFGLAKTKIFRKLI